MIVEPRLSSVEEILTTATNIPHLKPAIRDTAFRAWLVMIRGLDDVCSPTQEIPDFRDRIEIHTHEYGLMAHRRVVPRIPTVRILDSLKARVSRLEGQFPVKHVPSLAIFHHAIEIGDNTLFHRFPNTAPSVLEILNAADDLFFVRLGLEVLDYDIMSL